MSIYSWISGLQTTIPSFLQRQLLMWILIFMSNIGTERPTLGGRQLSCLLIGIYGNGGTKQSLRKSSKDRIIIRVSSKSLLVISMIVLVIILQMDSGHTEIIYIGWKYPQEGWVKLNCNGACKENGNHSGCGNLQKKVTNVGYLKFVT